MLVLLEGGLEGGAEEVGLLLAGDAVRLVLDGEGAPPTVEFDAGLVFPRVAYLDGLGAAVDDDDFLLVYETL